MGKYQYPNIVHTSLNRVSELNREIMLRAQSDGREAIARMHKSLPTELRDLVYSYLIPRNSILRIGNAFPEACHRHPLQALTQLRTKALLRNLWRQFSRSTTSLLQSKMCVQSVVYSIPTSSAGSRLLKLPDHSTRKILSRLRPAVNCTRYVAYSRLTASISASIPAL